MRMFSTASQGQRPTVKPEMEDSLQDQHAPLHKRSKQQQHELGNFSCPGPPLQYNPLDQLSPLGLNLRKSPSLLDLIQMRLSQGNDKKVGAAAKKKQKAAASNSNYKLKASNFPATVLRIGTWEYKSRHEGDLVAKCYFAKHKLVWEVLDGGLKNKIEIQWSDIAALKATYADDQPGTLDVVLSRPPLFFKERNPQPKKHALWQLTSDFTSDQASVNRRHYLQCPQGLLRKHFEKLIQCDPRLCYLSQHAEITLESPYFEPGSFAIDETKEGNRKYDKKRDSGNVIYHLLDAPSQSEPQSSSSKNEQYDFFGTHSELFPLETTSPSPALNSCVNEEMKEMRSTGTEKSKNLSCWDNIKVAGLHPSMSMVDLVRHIENRFSEYKTSKSPNLSNGQRKSLEVLDEISRCLFTDSQHALTSDEKHIMTRVNSLCNLLQKDSETMHNFNFNSGNGNDTSTTDNKTRNDQLNGFAPEVKSKVAEDSLMTDGESADLSATKQGQGMSRNNSVGELLFNLPRIASLPQIISNISDDFSNQTG